MPAYRWSCQCGHWATFEEASNTRSVGAFIRDVLLPSSWNQALLVHPCEGCGTGELRISYDFPRCVPDVARVLHIVGLERPNGYLPMMWAAKFDSYPERIVFDFKYLSGRRTFGLNRPAIVSRTELRDLLDLYASRANIPGFP